MSGSVIYPDLRPTISNVQALITSKWNKTGYRPVVVPFIESYYVDTALDNDADSWSIDIGDPRGDFIELFDRNNEIRVQLFGVGVEGDGAGAAVWGRGGLLTGIADEISYDEEGTITLIGRDLTALATDSVVPPTQWRAAKAWSIVEQQAKEIGFKRTNLARIKIVKKLQRTDGSETYWEFWYRLYRKEKMWIWCEPDGTLTAQKLNYTAERHYFLGTPRDDDTQYYKRIYIPVERAEIRKTTQSRVFEVQVIGRQSDNSFIEKQQDPTIRDWIKRPRKIVEDADAHTVKAARTTAWEEIFEGKVGSLELKLTVPDPGFIIRQNRIAHVRIPSMNIESDWFVVGSKISGGTSGFFQEVRLREKQYALTRRIPDDPTLHKTRISSKDVVSELGAGIAGLGAMPESWGTYFVNAAREWHGPWDLALFLACLLGICEHESNFQNIRQHVSGLIESGEWEPPPSAVAVPDKGDQTIVPGKPGVTRGFKSPSRGRNPLEQWKMRFANEEHDGYCNTPNVGVGPMQLTSINIKNWADDHFRPGYRDNFAGGRWHPEHNIWAGARTLRSSLKEISGDSGRDDQIWMGVMAFNRGVAGARSYFATNGRLSDYAQSIKSNVLQNYLPGIKSAIQTARETAAAAKEGQTSVMLPEDDEGPSGSLLHMTRQKIIVKFQESINPLFQSPVTRREAIVMAAMWGYYNRDQIAYTQSSQREKDFGPPPNVPAATDCSAFAEWCYVSAGAPNPGSTTYQQRDRGRAISYAQIRPGDLVFYGPDQISRSDHVGVYAGEGKVIEHGGDPGPIIIHANYRPIVQVRTYPT